MEIREFKRITKDCRDMNMRQIWDVIDDELHILRESIMSLGDKIVVESFTGDGSKILKLNHSYGRNHSVVFKNSVLQIKGKDYEETDPHTITMLDGVLDDDIITILIFMNDMLVNESDMVVEHIREIVDEKLDEIFEMKFKKIVDDEIENYLSLRGFIE